MDKTFLNYYNMELQFLREMSEEFALENPKIAGRLGLNRFGCTDPYVERLLEGVAYMSARIHQKLDAEFPRFTQSILNTVYPQYLLPTPALAMVEFTPDLRKPDLAGGFTIPRKTVLRSIIGKKERTPCQFLTTQAVTLWPIKLQAAEYEIEPSYLKGIPASLNARSALKIRLRTPDHIPCDQVGLDRLRIYLRDTNDFVPMRLYQQLFSDCCAIMIQSADNGKTFRVMIDDIENALRQGGFEEEHALFPYDPRTFSGYGYLREYFAFPQKFMFADIMQLDKGFGQCRQNVIDIVFVFNVGDIDLERTVTPANFDLFCTPVINLFTKRTDRVQLSTGVSEFHVVADRTCPLDYEILDVRDVLGYGPNITQGEEFKPFYKTSDSSTGKGNIYGYYTTHRKPRHLTEQERRTGARSTYTGSEMYLSLAETVDSPQKADITELGVNALCSNRDLPIHMPQGIGTSDFTLDINVPITEVRCIEGPTVPKDSFADVISDWRIINHVSLNYLSILDSDGQKGAKVLRNVLDLYGDPDTLVHRKQVDGIAAITARPITRRAHRTGPAAFIRGYEVRIVFNEDAYRASGFFLLGAILDRFIHAYVPINSFSETLIHTVERGDVMRWPARYGNRGQI